MAIQYKPTKQKKEKAAKALKEPKMPKMPKAVKPQGALVLKSGKRNKSGLSVRADVLRKPTKILIPVVAVAVIAIAALIVIVVVSLMQSKGEEIDRIHISSTPNKTVYLVGEDVDYTGLRVAVTRKNGESFTVRADKCQMTGFDSSEAGYKTITVSYEGFTSSFSVVVNDVPRPTPALVGISLETLPKTEYKVGEWLDTEGGMLVREYVDGSTARITLVNSYIFGWDEAWANGLGEYELTVKYVENGVIATTTYMINVTE